MLGGAGRCWRCCAARVAARLRSGCSGGAALRRALTQRGRVAIAGPTGWPALHVEGRSAIDGAAVPELSAALRGNDPAQARTPRSNAGALDGLLVQAGNGGERRFGARAARALRARARAARRVPVARRRAVRARSGRAVCHRRTATRPPWWRARWSPARGRRRSSSFPAPLRAAPGRGDGAVAPRRARAPVALVARQLDRERADHRRHGRAPALARARAGDGRPARASCSRAWTSRSRCSKTTARSASATRRSSTACSASEHGVAYERKGAWRYLLPDATSDLGQRPRESGVSQAVQRRRLAGGQLRPPRAAACTGCWCSSSRSHAPAAAPRRRRVRRAIARRGARRPPPP